ncbi:hypothetical protein [Streptomyces sp. NPDC058266]|uniref:hypothetical protein n=1 Tax=Streptomyces sp. NPDC058266 TaxID=3346412 RepID=UPI0036EB8B96
MPKEITPSAVYPAGTPIPTAPQLPTAPPGATNLPPWRRPAPAAPPPPPPPVAPHPVPVAAPDPGPIEHRVTVEVVFPEPEPEPEPGRWSRLWSWLTSRVKAWQAVLALGAAVIPIPWTGYSVSTTWASTVYAARDMSVGFAYALALVPFALAVLRLTRRPGTVPLFALVVTFAGLLGAADWYDAVAALTGVQR